MNRRPPGEKGRQDESFLFQVSMELQYERGFVARPNRRGDDSKDPDDATADLQFREQYEWAVGHNVSIESPDHVRPVTSLRTTWIPTIEVRRVETHEEPAVATTMDALADLADGDAVRRSLGPMIEAYGVWIEKQSAIALDSPAREATRKRLLKNARRAKDRIAAGIDLLATDPRDKRHLEDFVKSITPVRNDCAHFRPVPEREMDRAGIACEDLIGILAKI